MAREVYLDASALVKRYVPETGSPVLHHLFQRPTPVKLICLSLGVLEVISILVRRKNAGIIPDQLFQLALVNFRNEIVDAAAVQKASAADSLVFAAAALVEKHSVNGTDAVILRSALDLAVPLRAAGNDLLLIASDLRLIRAAQAEGLTTLNPEVESELQLDALLGP